MDCGVVQFRKGVQAMKSCTIKLTKDGIKVDYRGHWLRVDVEKVSVAMRRELPRHTFEIRKQLEKKEKENARRREEK